MDSKFLSVAIKKRDNNYLIQAFIGEIPIDYQYFNAKECREDGESVEEHLLKNAQNYYDYKLEQLRNAEKERAIVSFFELSPEWQAEAISNNEEQAEEILYIEPEEDKNPREHYLLDLSECIKTSGDSEFDGIIGVSNICAIGVNLSSCGEFCTLTYI